MVLVLDTCQSSSSQEMKFTGVFHALRNSFTYLKLPLMKTGNDKNISLHIIATITGYPKRVYKFDWIYNRSQKLLDDRSEPRYSPVKAPPFPHVNVVARD